MKSSRTSDSAGRINVPMKIRSRQPSLAKQFCRPAELADRDPVMAETFDLRRIAGAAQREYHRLDAARGNLVGDRERHGAAAGDHADG